MGANFKFSFDSIIKRLGANPLAVQIPIGHGHDLLGIIDLLAMKAFYFEGDSGEKVTEKEIPADMADEAAQWRHELIEKAVEVGQVHRIEVRKIGLRRRREQVSSGKRLAVDGKKGRIVLDGCNVGVRIIGNVPGGENFSWLGA